MFNFVYNEASYSSKSFYKGLSCLQALLVLLLTTLIAVHVRPMRSNCSFCVSSVKPPAKARASYVGIVLSIVLLCIY